MFLFFNNSISAGTADIVSAVCRPRPRQAGGQRRQNQPQGELVTVKTWEEFCTAHGYSKRKIDEDLQNLAAFGDNLLELQDRLGLNMRFVIAGKLDGRREQIKSMLESWELPQ